MPAPYPKELRTRVLKAWLNGEGSNKELAVRFMIGKATVDRWISRYRRTGSVEPDPMGGARRPYVVDEQGGQVILDVLDSVPDCTLAELCEMYFESRGVRVSPQTMSDTVRRLGYTRKRGSSVGETRPDLMW